MNWKVKALLQKALSTTKIGDNLNHIPATLNKKHHYNVALYQTHECIRKFNYCALDLSKRKTALEIGTGYSLISSIVLILLGFQKVITVDITKDVQFSNFKKQVIHLENSEILELISINSFLSNQEINDKIGLLKKTNRLENIFEAFNITYVAPYSFEDILNQTETFDYIYSQVVLEHVLPKILEELFQFTKKTLRQGQFSVHTINFIDHFTNPGFFQDQSISEFNFLKYSDSYWKYWAGNSIAYTNRLSYIYYIELCEKYDLNDISFIGENYRTRKELDSKSIHSDILKKYKPNINIADLTKYQRGTLIISNT